LNLSLSSIGYVDLDELDNAEDISASHKIDGSWELAVPYHVDTENAREIIVDKKNEKGFGISKVYVFNQDVCI